MGKPQRSDLNPFLPPCGPGSDFCLVVTTPENLVPSDSALYFLARRQDPGYILVPLLGTRSDTRGTGKSIGDFLSDSPFRRARRRMNHPAFRLPFSRCHCWGLLVRPRRGAGRDASGGAAGHAGGGWCVPRSAPGQRPTPRKGGRSGGVCARQSL